MIFLLKIYVIVCGFRYLIRLLCILFGFGCLFGDKVFLWVMKVLNLSLLGVLLFNENIWLFRSR